MRIAPSGLGPRFNFGLLVFMTLLAGAIALLVLFGFNRSQNAATEESRKGLEQTARDGLLQLAKDQAAIGDLAAGSTGQLAEIVARYYVDARAAGVTVSWDASRLERDNNGRLYDANPDRRSDLLVFDVGETLSASLLAEIAQSAVLDSAFAAALADFKARPGQENFRAIGVYFDSAAGFSRYYPPVGINRTVASEQSTADLLRDIGPEGNPERHLRWSPPYQDAAGQGLVLTAYVPVYDGDTFLGSMGVDLSAERLVAQVNSVRPSDTGFSFYLDQDGQVLETEGAEAIRRSLEAPGGDALLHTLNRMQARETDVAMVSIDGRDAFVAFAPVSVGGSFALVAPVDELTEPANQIKASIEEEGNRTVLGMLAVMSLLFAGSLSAAALLNRRFLLQPIGALAHGTREIAAGNLDAAIPVRRDDELGTLARSFNDMAAQIRARSEEAAEREEQYRSIFESTNDGMTIFSLDGRVIDVNPAMCRMHGYTREEFLALPPGGYIHSDFHNLRRNLIAGLREGRPYRVRARDVRKDGSTFDVEVLGSPLVYRGEVHGLGVVRDITEQIRGEQILELRVEERTRELQTLLGMSQSIASAIDLQPLLGLILVHLKALVDYEDATVLLFEDDHLRLLETRSRLGVHDAGLRGQVLDIPPTLSEVLRRRESIMIDDIRGDSAMASEYRKLSSRTEGPIKRGEVRSVLGVPLMLPDRVIGALEVSSTSVGAFSASHDELVRAVASQAASAIENARLYRELANRAREMEALARVATAVSFDLPDHALANAVAAAAVLGTGAAACAITRIEDGLVRVTGEHGLPPGYTDGMQQVWEGPGMMERRLARALDAQLIIERNYRESMLSAPELEPVRPFADHIEWDQAVIVPMLYGQEIRGSLNFYYPAEADVSEEDQRFLKALTAQAAIVLENIRLYGQAQTLAVLEERQRLSRELHDSVSQALYGIALGAKTARGLIDVSPQRAVEPLEFVLTLADAGIAEMRALIFELRPEALAEEGLVVALQKHGAALKARHQMAVEIDVCEEPDVPFAVKEALYRIAQESMNNIIKHARASHVSIRLADESTSDGRRQVDLEIRDNGIGFDPNGEFPGHLGLKSMRERSQRLRGQVEIRSAPGDGTVLRATFPIGGGR